MLKQKIKYLHLANIPHYKIVLGDKFMYTVLYTLLIAWVGFTIGFFIGGWWATLPRSDSDNVLTPQLHHTENIQHSAQK
jgi:hypothetical protein